MCLLMVGACYVSANDGACYVSANDGGMLCV